MTYRDENEALRARVDGLEKENRELRDKLAPPRHEAPPRRTDGPQGASSVPKVPPSPRPSRRSRWVLGAALGVGALGGILYVSSTTVQGIFWQGDSTFTCPVNGDVTIRNKFVDVKNGPAIALEVNCHLTLIHCDIRGAPAVAMSVNNRLVLDHSRLSGAESALTLGTNNTFDLIDSTIDGPILPLDAQVPGVTDLPLEEVSQTPHAVAPLEQVDLAQKLARLASGAQLVALDIVYAGANGMVDLAAPDYHASILYEFEAPLAVIADAGPAPIVRPGLPTPPPPPAPARRTVKRIRLDGKGMRVEYGALDLASTQASVVAPHCTLAQLWSAARKVDVPGNAVARIGYAAAAPGMWHFEIEGTEIKFDASNATCAPVGKP